MDLAADATLKPRRFRRLLVAGGAGFIGSHFVWLLRQTRPETEVLVLDKLTYAGNLTNLAGLEDQRGYQFVRGDICNREVVDRLASSVDAIVNFAADTHVDRSLIDPFSFIQTDVYGAAVLCDAARKYEHQVVLQVSTDEVYGHLAEGSSTEADRLLPRSPYSASKAGGELLANAYAESFGVPILITRGSNSYGPHQYPEKIVPLFITNAIDELPLPVYGDGSAVRDYLHVEDHCRAIDFLLHDASAAGVYNIGAGTEISGIEVARTVLELLGKSQRLVEHVADRPGHDYRYSIDASRLRELGWQPQVDFRQGMKETVDWYVQHQDWWRPLKSSEYWEFYRRNYRPLNPSASDSRLEAG